MQACNEHDASMLPSWRKKTNTMQACYEWTKKVQCSAQLPEVYKSERYFSTEIVMIAM